MSDARTHEAPAREPEAPQRVRSLDALRGLDMLMIAGGASALIGVSRALGLDGVTGVLEHHTEHPEWHGFTAWDLIFPLFLFLAGVSMPFSFAAREARGATRPELARHALRRGAVLVFLGLVYNGLFGSSYFTDDGLPLRWASVLGRIGLAWMFAALIVLASRSTKVVVGALVAVVAVHTILLVGVASPDVGRVSLAPGETFPDYIDRHITPGRLYKTVRDPEALVGVIPAIGTALLGVLAGTWMRRADARIGRTCAGLAAAGAACLALGGGLDLAGVPINKNLWSASFVFWAGGWSLLLLALAHALFDGLRLDRVGAFLGVFGANAILVYLVSAVVSWQGLAEIVFARGLGNGRIAPEFAALAGVLLQWAVFSWLYRRRIFLRV